MSGNDRARFAIILTLVAATTGCGSSGDDATPGDEVGSDATSDGIVVDTNAPPTDVAEVGVDGNLPEVGSDSRVEVDADADVAPPSTTPIVYVGLANGNVARFDLDATSGTLTAHGTPFAAGNFPSFLAFDAAHLRVFAVLEGSDKVGAFSLAPGTGALTAINVVGTASGPTHLAFDPTGAWLLTADYNAGAVDVFPIGKGGMLGASSDRQSPGTNAHQVVFDASGKFVFVPAKGSDVVAQYLFDVGSGKLTANTPKSLATAAKAGPRHLDFHPSGKWAYLIDELDSTISALSYDAVKGTFTSMQTVSTLPAGFDPKKNTGAEVHVAPSGTFVYGSNRGHDSIVAFSVDATTGKLTLASHTPTGGKTPRHFSLARGGSIALVANQDSSNVVTFRVSGGTLTTLTTTAVGSAAYWAGEVDVPR